MSDSATNQPPHDSDGESPTVAYTSATLHSLKKNAKRQHLGEEFGRYRIIHELGRGAMGTVFLGHDTQLQRDVAIKIPRFDTHHDPGIVQRFYREARVMATLHHPNLCAVFDVGEIDGVHYLTMAYIQGKRLSDVINDNHGMSQRQLATMVRKIALALEEAHHANIIHRDLKPANIMVDHRGEPVIMDFGLARREQSGETQLTQVGELMGTPEYMSPERIEGKPEDIGPSSDVFSLGVIMYQMLTGRLPFEGTMVYVIGKIVTSDPPRLSTIKPDVDPELERICLRAMARNADQRYATAGELAQAIEQFLQSEPAVRPATKPPQPAVDPAASAPDLGSTVSRLSGLKPTAIATPIDESLNDPDRLIANFFDDDDGESSTHSGESTSLAKIESPVWPVSTEVACDCGARFAARTYLAGKVVKCTKCGGAIRVPDAKIEVACNCGQRFAAKQQLAGKNVKCPNCSSPISIPPLPN